MIVPSYIGMSLVLKPLKQIFVALLPEMLDLHIDDLSLVRFL